MSINSNELMFFGVWSPAFYIASTKEEREFVINLNTEKRRELETDKILKFILNFRNRNTAIINVKKKLGLTNSVFISYNLNYTTNVKLLILRRVLRELKKLNENSIITYTELLHFNKYEKAMLETFSQHNVKYKDLR